MCGGRSSILHYGPLIETNYLYAPTPNGQRPSASLNKSNNPCHHTSYVHVYGMRLTLTTPGLADRRFFLKQGYDMC